MDEPVDEVTVRGGVARHPEPALRQRGGAGRTGGEGERRGEEEAGAHHGAPPSRPRRTARKTAAATA